MLQSVYRFGLIAALFGLLLVPGVSWGQDAPHVRDEAGLFGKAAKDAANANIDKISSGHKKSLLIETVTGMDSDAAKAHARKKFNSEGDGVYILIGKKPTIWQTVVGNKTSTKLFTKVNRGELD